MAIENFTTYTESDPSGYWSQTATKNSFTSADFASASYVYKDQGADAFGITFSHKVDVELTSASLGSFQQQRVGVWAVGSNAGSQATLTDAIIVGFTDINTFGANPQIFLTNVNPYDWDVTDIGMISRGTTYYLLIERNGATTTCKVYPSDSDRTNNTNIIDTLTITTHATNTYRYLHAGLAYEAGCNAGNTLTGFIENLDAGIEPSPEVSEDTTLTLSDAISLNLSQEKVSLSDTIILGASENAGHVASESPILTLSDEITFQLSKSLSDTIILCDKITGGAHKASYASKIIHKDGYLYIITDEDPAQLVKVNLSPPCGQGVVWETFSFNLSGEDLKNAKDAAINDTTEYMYIACGEGKIVKLPLSDVETRETIIIENNTDNMTSIDTVDDINVTLIGTDSSTGELYRYDESEVTTLSTRFDFLRRYTTKLQTLFDYIKGKIINLDFRFFHTQKTKIKTDFRFSPYNYTNITAIARTDFEVKIDDVTISDIVLPSIIVRHQADDISMAEFTLTRYFDKPDYDLEGNLSQITNNNEVTIYLQDNLIFEGEIISLNADADGEAIRVVANSSDEWNKNRVTKNIPIPSKTEQLHLYHAQVKNINIEKPDFTKGVTTFNGLTCVAGSKLLIGSEFTSDMKGEIIDIISGTNFLAGAYEIVDFIDSTQVELDRCPILKIRESNSYEEYIQGGSNGIGYVVIDNTNYRGIKVDLGEDEEEIIFNSANIRSPSDLALDVETGDFDPQPNTTYFWFATGIDLINNESFDSVYLGSSLAPIVGDLYYISGLDYKKQRLYNNYIIRQGYYYVGTYPYKDISVKNGKYNAKWKYEDREDGFYWTKAEEYDFIKYARDVADLEYEKIKNINGNITPITNATIDLTLDGYLYYGIALLTRINITNTTQTDIYKDDNGFPVSVKNIEINANDMKAHLTVDNQKSEYELELINSQYPDEPSVTEEAFHLLSGKFNLPTLEDIV